MDLPAIETLVGQIGAADVRKIGQNYPDAMPGVLATFQDALTGRDADALVAAAHKAKGGSRSLGESGLGDLYQQVELAARAADWEQLARTVATVGSRQRQTAEQLRAAWG